MIVFALLAPVAFAATSGGTTGGEPITLKNPLKFETLEQVVPAVVGILNNFAIPIVTIMVLIGGFQFMTAGGDPAKVEKGKKTLLYAVIGYAVIFMANAVVFIIENILGA